jgi:AraC-like DNA-binding protein
MDGKGIGGDGAAGARPRRAASDDSLDMLFAAGPKALARRRRVSMRTLRRQFVRAGTTISSYLRVARRESVIELLRRADLSLGEVARRLGFSSSMVLVRFVRREFGATPGSLRQRLRITPSTASPRPVTSGEDGPPRPPAP